MTPLRPTPVNQESLTSSSINEGWSYIYVSLWNIWFTLKIQILGTIVAVFIFLLSAIELMGPFTHLIAEGQHPFWQTPWVRYTLAALLFVTASIMIWHHGRLHGKVERYRNLVAFMMFVAANVELGSKCTPEDLVALLDALIHALHRRRKKSDKPALFNASILISHPEKPAEPFRIYAQDSGNVFQSDLTISENRSVAGKAVEYEATRESDGLIMYVPSTRQVHGVAIMFGQLADEGQSADDEKVFTKTEIVPATYQKVGVAADESPIACLLSVRIPVKRPIEHAGHSYSCAVLSLSGRKADCMDTVIFTAARIARVLFSEVV